MCKFPNAHAPGFRALSTDVRQWAMDAPALVTRRWAVEMQEIRERVREEMRERVAPFVSASPSWSVAFEGSYG